MFSLKRVTSLYKWKSLVKCKNSEVIDCWYSKEYSVKKSYVKGDYVLNKIRNWKSIIKYSTSTIQIDINNLYFNWINDKYVIWRYNNEYWTISTISNIYINIDISWTVNIDYQNRWWYQNSFQILVSKWDKISKEYYLQQSSILSITDLY